MNSSHKKNSSVCFDEENLIEIPIIQDFNALLEKNNIYQNNNIINNNSIAP